MGIAAWLQLWRRLFPRATISFIESDVKCAEKYKQSIEREAGGTLYMGNQANLTLLARIVSDSHQTGQYDIIIDDGGHNPTAQLVSLQGLWPALKSGGAYVEEDVHVRGSSAIRVLLPPGLRGSGQRQVMLLT